MNGSIGVAVIVLVLWCLLSSGARSRRRAYPIASSRHASGWSNSHVKRHEDGHARVARALGCRVRVDLDKGETVILSGPPLSPVEHAAIAYGGQARAGRGGHEQDDRIAEHHLRQVPASERAAARREAQRIAQRYA